MPLENKNPVQDRYDKELGPEFDPIKQAEQNGTVGDSNSEGVKNAEENPSGNWRNNVSSTGGGGRGKNTSSTAGKNSINNATSNHTGPVNANIKFASLKKKSPLVAIIITVVVGGIGIVGLLSPSLLIVQIKEIMVNKFDNQLTSMSSREISLYSKKMGSNLTKGVCTSVVSVLCKYETMSEKQVANFEKAGIKVNYDKTSIIGRAKPTSVEFNGEKIEAKNFVKALKTNPELRAATNLAYNAKFAGFADAIWAKASSFLGISKKAATIDGNTDEEKLKSIQDDTKNPAAVDPAAADEWTADNHPSSTPEEIAAHNAAAKDAAAAANSIASDAETVAKNAVKAAPEVVAAAETVGNALKVTGWMDNACSVFGAVQAVGYAAKAVRALQLARYAMIFLNVADQIKAGTAKPEDVSYLGTILTTEFITRNKAGDVISKKDATSSFGYNFAAYGKRGKMSTTASQFLAGGGLTGDLINVTSRINGMLFNKPKQTCKVLRNPFVSVGSLIGGVALFFVPGVGVAGMGWKDAVQGAAGLALQIAAAYAPALLKDIVAGVLVDKTTVGEASGDAITSGSSGIMGTAAKYGGNAPLTPTQAVAYSNLSSDVAEQYAQEDRLAYSPLDASNSNTFMGKIVGQLLPYASNMSSLSGIFSSIASITTGSFASLTSQTTNAASTDDYTMCQDYDYRHFGGSAGIATDPYCNVTYGIPPDALNADPVAIAQNLISNVQINETTGDPIANSNYAHFVDDCINRKEPLGQNDENDGKNCLYGYDYNGVPNGNYYIYYIDQRVQTGLEGDDYSNGSTSTTPTGTDPSVGNTNIDYTDNGVNIPCATGTTDAGIEDGYYADSNGAITLNYGGSPYKVTKVKVRTCDVGSNRPVNSQISASAKQMLKDNNRLSINSGFRVMGPQSDPNSQIALWFSNGQNPIYVAEPGTSNHQMGIAMDLACDGIKIADHSNPCFIWLENNAAKYGFKNYPPEPWHWSVSGS